MRAGKGRPFGAGNPGNRAGRPKGARNRTTVALEEILQGQAEKNTRKAIELAEAGDPVALRLCLDRLIPVRKDRPISFYLPAIETPADLTKATSAILSGGAAGDITPPEAAELSKLVETHVRALETKDFAERLAPLEANAGARR